MITCKECKSNNIKSRRNYSHGDKSKSRTTLRCGDCGSTSVESINNRRGRNNRK